MGCGGGDEWLCCVCASVRRVPKRRALRPHLGSSLALARSQGVRLVTFDAGVHALADGHDVELLTAL
jgi:hypothetical protein